MCTVYFFQARLIDYNYENKMNSQFVREEVELREVAERRGKNRIRFAVSYARKILQEMYE